MFLLFARSCNNCGGLFYPGGLYLGSLPYNDELKIIYLSFLHIISYSYLRVKAPSLPLLAELGTHSYTCYWYYDGGQEGWYYTDTRYQYTCRILAVKFFNEPDEGSVKHA